MKKERPAAEVWRCEGLEGCELRVVSCGVPGKSTALSEFFVKSDKKIPKSSKKSSDY